MVDSDAAFKFAVKNLSVNDKFILCHGRHLWNSYLPTYIPVMLIMPIKNFFYIIIGGR